MAEQTLTQTTLDKYAPILRDWWLTHGTVVVYIFKTLLACLLAAWIAIKLELDQPRTSVMTVAIVMQMRSGMVFAKSIYRFLGTLVGVIASFAMVALFAQERVLFLICMALWIGMCTAGSMVFRNHQSYAFVLSGYTMCIVGLPATLNPDDTFDIGLMRISEIMVGLFCATAVSDLVFPQRMWGVMLAAIRKRFADFSDLLRAAARRPRDDRATQSILLHFLGDILNLESLRASTVMEGDESRIHYLRLGLLNVEFMEVSTTFHAFAQLMRRQRSTHHLEVEQALLTLITPLVETLSLNGKSAKTEIEAAPVVASIQHFRATLDARYAQIAQTLPAELDDDGRLDFATGAEFIERFAQELEAYTRTYVAIGATQEALSQAGVLTERSSWSDMYFDPLAVALAGLRGVLVLVMMACIWIFTNWQSGIEAITLAVVTSTLFASTPSPSNTIKKFLMGGIFGSALGYICTFVLLPGAQGFLMLSLALAPPIAIVAWLTTRPATALFGVSAFLLLLMHVGFASTYNANHVSFINDTIADIFAIMVSSTMYGLIDLTNSDWARKRTAQALRNLVVAACREQPLPRRSELEKAARDLIYRSGNTARVAGREDREVVDWLLATLEIGHIVIEIRQLLLGTNDMNDRRVKTPALESVERIALLFDAPSRARLDAANDAINAAIQVIATPAFADLRATLRHDLTMRLHFLRSALLDTASTLASTMPALEQGAAKHAA